jgi:CelD/BcsL family acetyltransferase involved in cellulose biosynthesis
VELATAETLQAFWQALERLHTRRWRAVGLPGVLSLDLLMQAFLREAVTGWLDDGCVRLRALRIEGEIAAVLLCLQDGRAAHMYLAGFDPDRMAQGPGTLLIAETIQGAARERVSEIRFLRGREPYKRHWGAAPAPTWRRVLRRA